MRYLLVFFCLIPLSFLAKPPKKEQIATALKNTCWYYVKVTRNDTPIFKIGNLDTLKFWSDSFRYFIQSAQKKAYGTWSITYPPHFGKQFNFQIRLQYSPNSNLRDFTIHKLTKNKLVFYENKVWFYYKRKK